MKKKFIILGYGNPDRGDDGVAYHLLIDLIHTLSDNSEEISEFIEVGILELTDEIDLWYNLQLIPEVSQDLAEYENAIFIDAHTAEIPEPILITEIEPKYQNSPFTHHLTPATCISLTQKLFDAAPHAILITIRGYSFDFSRELSSQTKELAGTALIKIIDLLGVNR